MASVTTHSDFEAQENKILHCFTFSPHNAKEDGGPYSISKKTLILSLALLISYNDNPLLLETFFNVIKVFVFPAGKAVVVISIHKVIKEVQ